jgi:hypothetical protein
MKGAYAERSLKADEEFGFEGERNCFPYLRELVPEIQQNGRWAKIDFENDDTYLELKTRRMKRNRWETTLIPCDKIRVGKRNILVFNFSDELCYIEYNHRLFQTFEKRMFVCNDRGNPNDKEKLHYFIPVHCLSTLRVW